MHYYLALESYTIKDRGTVYMTHLKEEVWDFDWLIGKAITIFHNGKDIRGIVKAVERYMHAPPWREHEPIGIMLQESK